MLRTAMFFCALLGLMFLLPSMSQAQDVPFALWLDQFKEEAKEKGITQNTLDQSFQNIELVNRVVELDRKQPEFTLTFASYRDRILTDDRIKRGRAHYQQHKALLDKIAKEYKVPAKYILALWGIETDFGRVTGKFSVVSALATLAYDGRRSEFFRAELLNALQIIQEGHIAPNDMLGSWAGAMGQNQFMPSSFLRFAVDYDGDGHKNIWTSLPDVFASIANYLWTTGWAEDQSWGRAVRVPNDFDMTLGTSKSLPTAEPAFQKTLAEWQKLGVRRLNGQALPQRADMKAALVFPEEDGSRDPAFLVYDNYQTILKWNRSIFFATTVGLLSDQIEAGM